MGDGGWNGRWWIRWLKMDGTFLILSALAYWRWEYFGEIVTARKMWYGLLISENTNDMYVNLKTLNTFIGLWEGPRKINNIALPSSYSQIINRWNESWTRTVPCERVSIAQRMRWEIQQKKSSVASIYSK